jgi:hypothetical protein
MALQCCFVESMQLASLLSFLLSTMNSTWVRVYTLEFGPFSEKCVAKSFSGMWYVLRSNRLSRRKNALSTVQRMTVHS